MAWPCKFSQSYMTIQSLNLIRKIIYYYATLYSNQFLFFFVIYILFDQKQFSIEKYQLYIKCQVVIYLRAQLFYLTNSQLSKYNTINYLNTTLSLKKKQNCWIQIH